MFPSILWLPANALPMQAGTFCTLLTVMPRAF